MSDKDEATNLPDAPRKKTTEVRATSPRAMTVMTPANIDEAFRLAKALSMSGDMVPQHFQGRPEATMAAIIRGMEIGLAPMQALSNIAVINGRACLWGDAIPALMQKNGHTIDVEIEGEGENTVAIATLIRGDNGMKVVRRFSWQDAKRAGLTGKKGPWQQYPKRMLAHRARAWAARDGAADALMGLQIADEVQDYQPMKDVTPKTGFTEMAEKAREEAPKIEQKAEVSPFDAGAEAYRAGKSVIDCPHDMESEAGMAWCDGWREAHDADSNTEMESEETQNEY